MAFAPASPVVAFSASDRLAAWTENGGVYFVAGEILHLRRHWPIDRRATGCWTVLAPTCSNPAADPLVMSRRWLQSEDGVISGLTAIPAFDHSIALLLGQLTVSEG